MPGGPARGPTKAGAPNALARRGSQGYGGPLYVVNIGESNQETNAAATPVNPDIRTATDAASYSNTTWTPDARPNSVLVCACTTSLAAGAPPTPKITGNGVDWACWGMQVWAVGANFATWWFAADASQAVAGVTTIDFGGVTVRQMDASFFQIYGVDLSDGVSAAAIQRAGAAPSGTSGGVSFARPLSSPYNRVIVAHGHVAQEDLTPGPGLVTLDEFNGAGPARSFGTFWRPDAFDVTAPNALSFSYPTSSGAGILAIEVRALAVAPALSGYQPVGPSWTDALPAGAGGPRTPINGPPVRVLRRFIDTAPAGGAVVTGAVDMRGAGRMETAASLTIGAATDERGQGRMDTAASVVVKAATDMRSAGRMELAPPVTFPIVLAAAGRLPVGRVLPQRGPALVNRPASGDVSLSAPVVTGAMDLRSAGRMDTATSLVVKAATDMRSAGRMETVAKVVVIGRADARSAGRMELVGSLIVLGRADARSAGRMDTVGAITVAGAVIGRTDLRSGGLLAVVAVVRGPLIESQDGARLGGLPARLTVLSAPGAATGGAPAGGVLVGSADGPASGGAPAGGVRIESEDGPEPGGAPAGPVLIVSQSG